MGNHAGTDGIPVKQQTSGTGRERQQARDKQCDGNGLPERSPLRRRRRMNDRWFVQDGPFFLTKYLTTPAMLPAREEQTRTAKQITPVIVKTEARTGECPFITAAPPQHVKVSTRAQAAIRKNCLETSLLPPFEASDPVIVCSTPPRALPHRPVNPLQSSLRQV